MERLAGRGRKSSIASGADLEAALPVGVVGRELLAKLVAPDVLVREEELELEQVAEPRGLVPELAPRVLDAVLGRADQRELRDGAVHEEVDDRVAVVRRRQVLVGRDHPDRLRALVVAGEDAVPDERVERAAHALGRVEVELLRRREPAPSHVGEQVLERASRAPAARARGRPGRGARASRARSA